MTIRTEATAAGCRVAWDVDLLSVDAVRVYHAENPYLPRICRRGEAADAEPGWKMAVDDLFEDDLFE